MRHYFILCTLFLFTVVACSRRTCSLFNSDGYVKKSMSPYVPEEVYKQQYYTINTGSGAEGSLQLRYLGCGGLHIEGSTTAIMIDPFFSNHGLIRSGPIGWVKTKENVVKKAMKPIESSVKAKVEGVYVTHSHYDHLLDVPYIYETYLKDEGKAKIYTSQSGEDLLANMDGVREAVVNMEDTVISSWYQKGKQYVHGDANAQIVVTPLKTSHAPHFHGVSLYKGEADEHKCLDETDEASWTSHWKLGQTFAFLIDVKDADQNIVFRMYVQSSAAPPKYGWLNEGLLAEKNIDLAVIGAASFAYTNDYPESLVRHLQPEKILICHWEDFFLRYHRKHKRIVRGTNLNTFINRLNAVFPYATANDTERFTFTTPGTDITVKY